MSLIHLAVLEPLKFEADVVVVGDLRKTENKNKRDEALAQGKFIAREDDFYTAKEVVRAIRKHKMADFLVTKGENEVSGFAIDPLLNVEMKIRPDAILHEQKIIVDLKSVSAMNVNALEKYMYSKRYNYQSAFYRHVNKIITGENYKMVHILVETKAPFAVRLISFSEGALDLSFNKVFELMKVYAECVDKAEWPGYTDDIIDIGIPSYAIEAEMTEESYDYK